MSRSQVPLGGARGRINAKACVYSSIFSVSNSKLIGENNLYYVQRYVKTPCQCNLDHKWCTVELILSAPIRKEIAENGYKVCCRAILLDLNKEQRYYHGKTHVHLAAFNSTSQRRNTPYQTSNVNLQQHGYRTKSHISSAWSLHHLPRRDVIHICSTSTERKHTQVTIQQCF